MINMTRIQPRLARSSLIAVAALLSSASTIAKPASSVSTTPLALASQSSQLATHDAGDGDPLMTDSKSMHEETVQFAADAGITFGEASERLKWQSAVPLIEAKAKFLYGASFTGVWIDQSDGDRIKIGVVAPDPDHASVLEQYASEVGVNGVIDIVPSRFSEVEVESALTVLRKTISRAESSMGIRYNPKDNQIRIRVSAPIASLPEKDVEAIAAIRSEYKNLVVVYVDNIRPTSRGCVYPYCDPPLRAGIRVSFVQAGCTGAFLARGKTDNVLRQISAAHCTFGQGSTSITTKTTAGVTKPIGPIHTADWSTVNDSYDLASYNVSDNTYWQSRAWVFVTSSDDTVPNTEYPIYSDSDPTLGMRVCTTGAYYSRTDCGNITDTDVDETYCEGSTCRFVTNMMAADFCGIGGDSGAPVYSSNAARGIQVAGASECDSWMVKKSYLETGLNVNISHDGG